MRSKKFRVTKTQKSILVLFKERYQIWRIIPPKGYITSCRNVTMYLPVFCVTKLRTQGGSCGQLLCSNSYQRSVKICFETRRFFCPEQDIFYATIGAFSPRCLKIVKQTHFQKYESPKIVTDRNENFLSRDKAMEAHAF
jgi:hypothetical protein